MNITPASAFADSKPHYALLDGLRGVAALVVIWYHVFEGFCTSAMDWTINHGHLGVDFFFLLSGFVISYAYDDRWGKMTLASFAKRRLIRLQPMVFIALLFGAVMWLVQGGEHWDGTKVEWWWLLVAMVMTFCFIPAPIGSPVDIRGNGELFSVNGPQWSLFFEYIANILYALVLRRLSNRWLAVVTIVSGAGFAYIVLGDVTGAGAYNTAVGWTLANNHFWCALVRIIFLFSLGMLLARNFRSVKAKGAFWICSILLIVALAVPYIGAPSDATTGSVWNGIYELACVTILFPAIIYLASSGKATDGFTQRLCTFLGDISYPLYIFHYPVMYIFYWWVWRNGYAFADVWYMGFVLFFGNIALAYAVLKLYDEPMRRWLNRRLKK